MPAAATVESDVAAQRLRDRDWEPGTAFLVARVRAVAGASRALERGEEGAVHGMYGALVDLSAASAELASLLPAPR